MKFKHTKTGGTYVILNECLMKNVQTNSWEDAILYTDEAGKNLFVREKKDFMEKFARIEEAQNG